MCFPLNIIFLLALWVICLCSSNSNTKRAHVEPDEERDREPIHAECQVEREYKEIVIKLSKRPNYILHYHEYLIFACSKEYSLLSNKLSLNDDMEFLIHMPAPRNTSPAKC